MTAQEQLPPGVTVFERGWLSANNILFKGRDSCALVDSGFFSHSAQTVALVEGALGNRSLDLLVNTHLHSDHCGGNAALQARWPRMVTAIPPGHANEVACWNAAALSYVATGQFCPRFSFTSVLSPGSSIRLGDISMEVHAAPGHDPHSVVLFERQSRVLISADALWQSGFGVVFPEIEGEDGFDDVAATLDLIESLHPRIVIPGHGAVFYDMPAALAIARRRLDGFIRDPRKHASHAAKVLLKFKLLELQRLAISNFVYWARATSHLATLHVRYFAEIPFEEWIGHLISDLMRSGAAEMEGDFVVNA